MSIDLLVCAIGHHPIPYGEPYYVRVQGWAKPGRGQSGKSGSSIVLRETLPAAACATCITRVRSGFNPAQGAMF